MYRLMFIFGTRPEIIKMAPIIRHAKQYDFELVIIHSGQHYDYEMSKVFLEELGIDEINENLNVGSGSHGTQLARMIEKYEKTIMKYTPDIVLALGDTNTVAAAALVCSKINIPFGHVEAGIRSYDLTMPEEFNRRFAGIGAGIHFAPTKQAILNLYYEGIDPSRIYLTGNTIVDATKEHASIAKQKSKILEKLDIQNKRLIAVTFHRPANVDSKDNLEGIVNALISLKDFTLVIPVHPRTKKQLKKFNLEKKLASCGHIILTEPMSYLDFLLIMQESEMIITDSGGLQEEAISLKKPCITLRTNTERPETVKLGVNFLVGSDTEKIIQAVQNLVKSDKINQLLQDVKNPYGDGTASINILQIIKTRLENQNLKFTSPSFLSKGSIDYKLVPITRETSIAEIETTHKGKVTLVYNAEGIPINIPLEIRAGWYVRIQY